ncbi:MAG: DUF6531 domain-containing protein [Waddliaceae bacterium]
MQRIVIQGFFFTLLAFVQISAESDFRLDGQADPSTYIHECVNAITGTFIYSFPDIVVDGPEPLSFVRHYCSNNHSQRDFGTGFTHNHPIKMNNLRWHWPYKSLSIEESGGDCVHFSGIIEDKKAKSYWFYLDPVQLQHGVTNTSGGEISGRANIKNTKLYLKKEDLKNFSKGKCTAHLGDGTKRYYAISSHMTHEVRPSGNIVHYKYDKKDRITEIYVTDPLKQTRFGWMRFTYEKKKKRRTVRVVASNGKKGTYTFSEHNNRYYSDPTQVLDSCSITSMPKCAFEYKTKHIGEHWKVWMIKEIDWGKVGKIRLGYNDDHQVKGLYLPGTGKEFVKVYDIHYHPNKKYTSIKDIKGGKTIYAYSRKKRLKRKERYHRDKIYSSQLFFWDEKSSTNKLGKPLEGEEGNLITKGIADAKNKLLSLTTYTYDQFGNILTETLAGNLTGDADPAPFGMLKHDSLIPDLKGREIYRRFYTYSKDGYNLPLSMREDDGTGWKSRYLPNTDKPKQKLYYAGDTIAAREFFTYNRLRILTKTIVDDGNTDNPENLQCVTQRKITTIVPNMKPGAPGLGKAKRIIESYWDPQTGREHQLKRIDYAYGIFDLVTDEQHYDADNQLRYVLRYKYDAAGNCIKKSDPLGRVTHYQYNENNLCTFKELVGSGYSTTYIYDNRGRLIKSEENHQSGERFVQQTQYDSLNRKIADIDHFGNTTTYRYDDMGRLIATIHPSFAGDNGRKITPVETKSYNIWDRVIAEKNPRGDTIKACYNCRGQVTRITYPDGTSEGYCYNRVLAVKVRECNFLGMLRFLLNNHYLMFS